MARLNSGGLFAGGDRMRCAKFAAPLARSAQPARYRNGPNENSAADKLPHSGR